LKRWLESGATKREETALVLFEPAPILGAVVVLFDRSTVTFEGVKLVPYVMEQMMAQLVQSRNGWY
jgi:hypothetical protein